ncbi:MAG: tfuA protein [Gammaproteobacteria bacterium]|nr:tfuA protein [Gammaproteobacteria bacterium]
MTKHQDLTVCVFAGPTISHRDAEQYLDATFLPPAGMGDLFLCFQKYKPDVIALIDGVFLNEPAVWHKEIMWLLSQSVTVFGCSSMGALRAAELHCFGMRGSGLIFNAYVTGSYPGYPEETFEDDDEVAVIHAPDMLGFTPISEAMVNIRSTMMECSRHNIITFDEAKALVDFAKTQFYQQRSFKAVLNHAEFGLHMSAERLAELTNWIDTHKINQKADDAVEMLKLLSNMRSTGLTPPVSIEFEATDVWNAAVAEITGPNYENRFIDPTVAN